jgi:hypothetical protein
MSMSNIAASLSCRNGCETVGRDVLVRLRCAEAADVADPDEWGEHELQLRRALAPASCAAPGRRRYAGRGRATYDPAGNRTSMVARFFPRTRME